MDYSHLRGYLHSEKLKWSYGAMKGREGDAWEKSIASESDEEMVKELQQAGFKGIYVDTYGYKDSGFKVIQNLSSILKNTTDC